jgi:hypothetical protein
MRSADLTQAHTYRIDGIAGEPDAGWSYIGELDGVVRFLDRRSNAVMLDVDRLTEVGTGHLQYKDDN